MDSDRDRVEINRKANERRAQLVALAAKALAAEQPRRLPHRPPSEDTDYRLTVAVNCELEGLNDYKIAPHIYPLQHDKTAQWKAAASFLRRHRRDGSFAQRRENLLGFSSTERAKLAAEAERKLKASH